MAPWCSRWRTAARSRFYFAPRAPRRSSPRAPERVAEATAVARGWHAHLERAAAFGLPDESLVRAYRCATRRLLLTIDGADFVAPGPQSAFTVDDETTIASALARVGLGSHVAPLLVGRMDDQRVESWARRGDASMARNLAALRAIVAHWRATRDTVVAQAVLVPAVRMAQWCGRRIERGADATSRSRVGSARRGSGRHGARRRSGRHRRRDRRLRRSHRLARARAAAADDAEASLATPTTDGAGDTPSRRGLDLRTTIERASAEIDDGLVGGFDRLLSVTECLSAAGSWPSFVHPRLNSGSGGLGDDPLVCARFVDALGRLAVIEDVEGAELAPITAAPRRLARSVDRRGAGADVRRNARLFGALAWSARGALVGARLGPRGQGPVLGPGAFARVVEQRPIGRGSDRAARAMRQ